MKPFRLAIRRASFFALLVLGLIAFNAASAHAQGVAGGTQINNRASVSYTEPDGASVNTVSNTVTVTVQNVTGLVITPDAGTPAGVNAGASNVVRTFTISNTGNIAESITFGASGASLITSGPMTITAAYADVNGNGSFDGGDIDILTAVGPLSLNFGLSVNVIVTLNVSPTATVGQVISLQLGDATANAPSHDNVAADATPGSVKTVGSTGINGNLEARGDLSFSILSAGAVFIGPLGQPLAVGPTNNNDDYTNKTLTAGVSVPQGGTTTAGGALVFRNSVLNQANIADSITIAPQGVPAGFTVEVSADGIAYSASINITVPAGGTSNILVRVTAPAGISVLSGYSSVLRATSSITPQNFNETIDRLYTGFLRVDKSVTVINSTGIGGPTDAVPGAIIQYTINYSNVTATSGANNAELTATTVIFTEDGNAAPNNWATTTDHVVGSVMDSNGGQITGDVAGSSLITVELLSLGPGQSGNFVFRRVIK